MIPKNINVVIPKLIPINLNNMLNDKKTIRAWAFYDWANSAYNLIITSAIFPAYFTACVPDKIDIFGTTIASESIASWSIALAFFVIACVSPILGAIADTKGNKKAFMRFFCTIGAIACAGLFFFKGDKVNVNTWYGVGLSVLACIGYCGSIVFYNAYLPEIASKDQQDSVSAKGFIMGYIGSVSLLISCLAFILLNDKYLWVAKSLPPRISFVLVGLWWIGFSQIPFAVLKDNKPKLILDNQNILASGFAKLKIVWLELQHQNNLKNYLWSFFFITMGVQTIMYMATYFAAKEIKLQQSELIIVVLIIQIVAIFGAWLFSKISKVKGNIFSIAIMLVIWIGVCAGASYLVYDAVAFYILAFVVGLIMGGTQSLCRSTFSKMLPLITDGDASNKVASYFSFLDFVEKMGIVIGTTTFGIIANITGMRMSALFLGIYFLAGLLLLLRVKYDFKNK
jgi:MFS transporter, UMF1 family